ncbi:hypothetical protein [Nocardioides insulae]|uniref:hypothetical protein n=1 Tax=Nocardioides insulae TaxID=394734 RepID=UPI00040E9B46|nr:hypothetical protein [Nocardioides insulae]
MSAPHLPTGSPSDPARARAWGWVAHLREGGTTPWRTWLGTGGDGSDRGRYLPGAQQLELLRRLNEVGRPGPDLAGRVLAASAPGRGRPDRELLGAAPATGFGLPPVDPEELPVQELMRVATSLLAEDVANADVPPLEQGLLRPWRRRSYLGGDPWLIAPMRDHLLVRGRPQGGRRPIAVLVGRDLPGMLADAWTARCFDDGVAPWGEWMSGVMRRRALPPRANLLARARWWAERVGHDRVHVVLDRGLVPGVLGLHRPLPLAPRVSVDAADLARRLVPVLGLLAPPAHREDLLRRGLAPRLATYGGQRPGFSSDQLAWLETAARRQRDGLLVAGYAVHGDPDVLVPPTDERAGLTTGAGPTPTSVFELALRVLLDGRSSRSSQEGSQT